MISGLESGYTDMDDVLYAETQLQLLLLLRQDLELDDHALDQVLTEARELAAQVEAPSDQ